MAKTRPKKDAEAVDQAMLKARELFERSGMTLPELAEKMGYTGDTARQSVWQFLNRTNDPRLSMLRKFTAAVGVPIERLFKAAK